MFHRIAVSIFSLFLFQHVCHAQDRGIVPLTGIHYFNEGVSAKNIEVKIDGSTLVSNRIALNKEFEVKLLMPSGFTQDRANMIFAAVEVIVVSMKGDIVFKTPNVFKDNETRGFAAANFKEIVLKLVLKPEYIKADQACTIKLRYYDLKSKNQLRLEFPVAIARPGEAMQTAKLINDIKTSTPSLARAIGIKAKNINVTVDTSIRVAPKMAYTSLDISNIEGTSISEVLSGKESFWVYDADLNEVKISDKQLKQVGGAMEDNVVNYLSKIPYRLKTTTNKSYTVRFRWESSDKRKIIDVVVTK